MNTKLYIKRQLRETLDRKTQETLDMILDKISATGYESLTTFEKGFLRLVGDEKEEKSDTQIVSDWLEETLGPLQEKRIVYYRLLSYVVPGDNEVMFNLKLIGEEEGGDYIFQIPPFLVQAMNANLQNISDEDLTAGIKKYVAHHYGHNVVKIELTK